MENDKNGITVADEQNTNESAVAEEQEVQPPVRRTRLPYQMVHHNLSLWQLLKASIGKDLTHINMPLEIFEPLGVLQVFCEELEYSELLDQAAEEKDPFQRMVLITCFAVSRYAATKYRGLGKPFNPLEGETYECVREDMGWRYVSEQVSHHPGISASHAQGRGWVTSQSAQFAISLWGLYLRAKPKTPVDVTLTKVRETYRWNKVTTDVRNLFFGKRYIDHLGEMVVKCSNGITSKIHFKKKERAIDGNVYDLNNKPVHEIKGDWSEYLNCDDVRIWTANPIPIFAEEQYGFNNFAVTLNQITDDIQPFLPPTDTRFRPDQRLLEENRLAEGRIAKDKLEVDQRARRKKRTYVPKWFTNKTQPDCQVKVFQFNKRYWEARKHYFDGEEFDKLWEMI